MGEGLPLGGGVHIGHHRSIGVSSLEGSQAFPGDEIRHGTTCPGIRHQNRLSRGENLRGLRHEVDAAEQDDVGIRVGGLLGESEGVPYEVAYILNLDQLIIVTQNDGVQLLLPLPDPMGQLIATQG